ncbi:MAG TPA: M48 family metalloprotease [Burkholderiales bacterium]|nr:M48 family metalloprotease [Burkholderiales bacterium]
MNRHSSAEFAILLAIVAMPACMVSPGPSQEQLRAQQEYANERMREATEMMESQMQDMQKQMEQAQAEQQRPAASLTPEEKQQRAEQWRAAREQMKAAKLQDEAMNAEIRKDPRMARAMDESDREHREAMRKDPSGMYSQFNLGDKEEAALGLEMVPMLMGRQKLVGDAALQQYVNKVGRWIAQQSERPGLPWQFAVIDSDAVNAFAVPGGYIFITRGMLVLLEGESELAGVLGHEISHVVRKHHLRWVYMNKQMQSSMQQTQEAIRKYNPSMLPQMQRMDQLMQKQAAFLNSGPMRSTLSQSEEMQADTDGATLAWRAGYDAYGLVSALQRFEAYQRPRYAAQQTALQDHPEPVRRLKMLDVALRSRAEKDTLGEGATERYLEATRSLRERGS